MGIAAASAFPWVSQAQTAAPSTAVSSAPVDLALVNPEFRPRVAALLQAHAFGSDLMTATLAQTREAIEKIGRPMLPAPEVTRRIIPGPKGAPDLKIYITGVAPGTLKPAVLHIHGGGYVLGSAASSRALIQDLTLAHNCVALSVEYRLAPETPFPGSLEDNYAALRWLYNHAAELGVDRTRIAVKGESAGGGHAAALAIAVRDRGEFPLCLQILLYPMLDDRTGSSVDAPACIGQILWTRQSNRFGWTSLLGRPAGSAVVPPNAVPARVDHLAGVAPAWIGVGSIDLFVGEDLTYARRLVESCVATEVHVVPGAFHGFDAIVPQAPLSVAFNQAWNAALTRAFNGASAPARS